MSFNVSKDQGDGSRGPASVQLAPGASLNTAYTDLLHRVGTQNVLKLAGKCGVTTGNDPNGSGLESMRDQVGIALGQASLTVEEQATMFNTLANGGEDITPHVIKRITQGSMTTAATVSRVEVLTPDIAADGNLALSFHVQSGGPGTHAALPDDREHIHKTGTPTSTHSEIFLCST